MKPDDLRLWLKQNRMSQQELARIWQMPTTTMSGWVRHSLPHPEVVRLALERTEQILDEEIREMITYAICNANGIISKRMECVDTIDEQLDYIDKHGREWIDDATSDIDDDYGVDTEAFDLADVREWMAAHRGIRVYNTPSDNGWDIWRVCG